MSKKIALIGDLIIDKFINYKSLRLSPEGPAPIVKKDILLKLQEELQMLLYH